MVDASFAGLTPPQEIPGNEERAGRGSYDHAMPARQMQAIGIAVMLYRLAMKIEKKAQQRQER
jgi:hypothetical protein